MTRNEAIELLEKYNGHLMKEGFADCDLWCEPPTAIDGFFATKWAKEKFPIKPITCDHLWKYGNDECRKCGVNIKDINQL